MSGCNPELLLLLQKNLSSFSSTWAIPLWRWQRHWYYCHSLHLWWWCFKVLQPIASTITFWEIQSKSNSANVKMQVSFFLFKWRLLLCQSNILFFFEFEVSHFCVKWYQTTLTYFGCIASAFYLLARIRMSWMKSYFPLFWTLKFSTSKFYPMVFRTFFPTFSCQKNYECLPLFCFFTFHPQSVRQCFWLHLFVRLNLF